MPPSPMTGIVTIFVFSGFFAMVAFTVWVVVTGRRHREHMRFMADFTTRMLDRMASTRDFADFLQSEAATKLLANLAPERTSAGPQPGIFRTMQAGIVVTVLGIGALVLDSRIAVDDPALTIVGGIAISLGLGFLLSSVASYRLAGKLGLLTKVDARSNPQPQDQA
jgi:hypothetical protein